MDFSFSFVGTLIIFIIVYGLIVFRNIRGVNIPIWASMCAGAISVLALNIVKISDAFSAINFDVMFFLFGMFVLVSGLESSGTLHRVTNRILSYAKTPKQIVFLILVVMGLLSAFLINDTVALVATPIVLGLAKTMNMRPAPLLISLAFGITIGSMMTPMGNPQNLLIALHSDMRFPLLSFLGYLFLPTIACLVATYYIVTQYYKKEIRRVIMPNSISHQQVTIDDDLAKKSSVLLICTVVGFFAIGIVKLFGVSTEINFSHIALFGGIALLAISKKKKEIIRGVNWQILVFFVAMFVFVQGLLDGGVIALFETLIPLNTSPDSPTSTISIIGVSVIMSQAVSNVPFVAIYLPILQNYGFTSADVIVWIVLAAGSTLAGNLTILGAASNVIILEAAERRKEPSFTFKEFFRIGSVVTTANVLILIIFILIYSIIW
ncbi:MAG: SLC13 family permease [Candidatus Nitrosotenuis sp.]